MRMNLILEILDVPGQLVSILNPIGELGANVVTIVHKREISAAEGKAAIEIAIEGERGNLQAVVDKFKEMKLTPIPAEKVSCPMIEESPVNLECKVVEVHRYPTHDMFVGEIVAMHVDESIFDENGKMPVESIGLLAYAHGHYLSVKRKPIGRFGYSVMKAKTKKRLNREAHQERVEKNRARREKRGAAGSGRPANKSKKK
jgi:flavin reductase (DIM6/NTAB) family NADH-FMN oxidoreductase RutF